MLTHTIHLDALLLALIQRHVVDASSAKAVQTDLDSPEALVSLEREHFDFKRRYWRTALTHKRTSPSDQTLQAFQRELLTYEDLADVEQRVRDGARLARSLRDEETRRSQQHLHDGQQRLNRMVQNASVVIGAFGLSYTAAPVIAPPSAGLFALATFVGFIGMALAFLVLVVLGKRPDVAQQQSRQCFASEPRTGPVDIG